MKKPVLFIVNDNTEILQTLAGLIQNQFKPEYRVLTAASGEDGLTQTQACSKDDDVIALFLADQQMPGMSGMTFLAEAGKLYPQARKALLSDFADSETAIRSINEIGIDRYFVQPLAPEEVLYPAITDLLDAWQTDVRLPAMLVKGIMNNQAARIRHDSNLRHAAEIVALSGVGDLMVIDQEGDFVGVLSEGDILRAALPNSDEIISEGGTLLDAYHLFLRKGQELSERPIMPLVIRNPLVLHPDDHVAKAATVLINLQIRRLPVVENGRLLGTVSRANICQAVVGGW
jgi:CBS domain-containing protein/CheY-like chemotaxis protein